MFQGKKLITALILILLCGALSPAGEDDFLISKKTPNKNYLSSVAFDKKGNAVVVWASENEKDFTGQIYASFMKYKSASGTYRVKNPKLISSKDSETNLTPFVFYSLEEKCFYCAWARTFPGNTNGSQLVIRKLTSKGKPTGDIKILSSEMLEYCYSPQVIRYPDNSNVNYAGTSYQYAITYNLVDRKDNKNQTSQVWMANLEKTPTALKGAKRVYSTKFQDNDLFYGALGLGEFTMLADGSFLLPFTLQDDDGHTAYVIKISSDFDLDKTLEIGPSVDAVLHLANVSDKYAVLTWTGFVGTFQIPLIQNQALTTSLTTYKGAYNPISNSFGQIPAIASLEQGGALQLVTFLDRIKGVMVKDSGMAGKVFENNDIKYFSYDNTMREIPGKNKVLLVYTANKNKGVYELKGLVVDIPK